MDNNEIAIIFKKVLLFKEISRRGGACLHPSPSGGDELPTGRKAFIDRPYAGLNLLPNCEVVHFGGSGLRPYLQS